MKMRLQKLLVAVALCIAGTARAESKPQLAVMDFEAKSADAFLAESATDAAVNSLRDLRVFKVISRTEIKQMLTIDKERSTLSNKCSESSCLAEIGNAIGARYIVRGDVQGMNKQPPFTLQVSLFDMKRAEVVASERRTDLKTPKEVMEVAPTLALAAVRPILDKEQGYLELVSRETGATVSIDGRAVGTTPFPLTKLGWGPHRVVVEKEKFIAWAKDVQVERNQTSTEVVTLIPNPDFINSYRTRNKVYRYSAVGLTALAVGGLGTAGYFQFAKVNPLHDQFAPLQEAFSASNTDPTRVSKACSDANFPEIGACYDHAKDLANQGSTALTIARVGVGVGLVSAAAATYFWLAGEDPGRYDAFVQSNPEGGEKPAEAPAEKPAEKPADKPAPKAGLFLAPSGGFATVSFSF